MQSHQYVILSPTHQNEQNKKKKKISNIGKGMDQLKLSYTAGRPVNTYNLFRKLTNSIS
jgi:hypothetical protein